MGSKHYCCEEDPLLPALLPLLFIAAFPELPLAADPVVSELPRLAWPDIFVELLTRTLADVPDDERLTVRLCETPLVATIPRRRFSTMVRRLDGALA